MVNDLREDWERGPREGKMSEWKYYRKKQLQKMRPYIPGEDMTGISISAGDKLERGGMIARGDDPTDMWYVSKPFFEKNYEGV